MVTGQHSIGGNLKRSMTEVLPVVKTGVANRWTKKHVSNNTQFKVVHLDRMQWVIFTSENHKSDNCWDFQIESWQQGGLLSSPGDTCQLQLVGEDKL